MLRSTQLLEFDRAVIAIIRRYSSGGVSSITIAAIISINGFASTRKLAPCLTLDLA
jgi:hypothetical protein